MWFEVPKDVERKLSFTFSVDVVKFILANLESGRHPRVMCLLQDHLAQTPVYLNTSKFLKSRVAITAYPGN